MNQTKKEEIKKSLLDFTIKTVEKFLKENPKLEFYAFAYDCYAEYAEVNLCFNTEKAFEKTLKNYQTRKFSRVYQTASEIENLKYNTGNWEYQCFDTTYILTEEQLNEIFNDLPDDNYASWKKFVEKLMELFCECLIDFAKTETYRKIPKTKDFKVFCIDHDEDFENVIERLKMLNQSRPVRNKVLSKVGIRCF
jgi:hypothetical protein